LKTVFRPRPATIPNAPEPIQKWCAQENLSNKNLISDLEEEFGKIGAVKKWTPVLTFATPGNLSVAYTSQDAEVILTKGMVELTFRIAAVPTFTTASGNLQITGCPYTASTLSIDSALIWHGGLTWGGITKAGYTQVNPQIAAASNVILFTASGSGSAPSAVTASDVPTGGSVVLRGTMVFRIRS
jgi:hypothetical protein